VNKRLVTLVFRVFQECLIFICQSVWFLYCTRIVKQRILSHDDVVDRNMNQFDEVADKSHNQESDS